MEHQVVRDNALREIREAKDTAALDVARIKYLGRKGAVTELLRSLKDRSIEEKKALGPIFQVLKNDIEKGLASREVQIGKNAQTIAFDETRPGVRTRTGHLHPLTIVSRDMCDIFRSLNFSVVDGPELETEHYNFDALNMPPHHPAREMWDTFWIKRTPEMKIGTAKERLLLRTHTSPVQVRYMESHKAPFRIVVPGRTFRYEAINASHEINFYQFEGLMAGDDITIGSFKFVIEEFFRLFFGREIEFRYRVSYFPFVEPGLEMDVKFKGKWFEIMGAGMVHPEVFKAAKVDPKKVQGFAFGMCIDRLAMIKYEIPDIRLLYEGDLRFVEQF